MRSGVGLYRAQAERLAKLGSSTLQRHQPLETFDPIQTAAQLFDLAVDLPRPRAGALHDSVTDTDSRARH